MENSKVWSFEDMYSYDIWYLFISNFTVIETDY